MFDLCLWRVQTKSKSTWMSLATHCYFITMSHLSIRGSPSDGEYFRESEKSSAVLECTHLTLFLSHMWVGWLGRVLMWFEKLFGRLQDLVHFGSRSWKLLPFCFPALPPWSPLRGEGEKVSMGFTLLSFPWYGCRCLKFLWPYVWFMFVTCPN